MRAPSSSRCLLLVAAIVLLVVGGAAQAARADTINFFLYELTNNDAEANAVGVQVTVEDVVGGVKLTATVKEIAGLLPGAGDILGLWFDVKPWVNLSAVTYTQPYIPPELNVTGFVKNHDGVGAIPFGGSGPNINGMPGPFDATTNPYDIAMRFGTNGMAADYYPTVSLILTNLSTAAFEDGRFAARVNSIGDDNQASGKYAGFGSPPVVPTPSAVLGGLALLGLVFWLRMRAA